jgi:TolA-binding protein
MAPFMRTPHPRSPGPQILVALLLVTFTGCAYYNTFYLAKRYMREGQKAQDRFILDTPAPEAVGKYDGVIRQCAKILVDYPKSKWVDDAVYYMGAALYGKGDYPAAIKKFGELRASFPKSPYVPDSKLMEALSLYRRKEYVEAETMFREVGTQHPNLKRKWELYYYGAENEVGLRNYPAALAWYKRAAEAAQSKRERARALRRMGDAHIASKDYQSAQADYAQALKNEDIGARRLDLALQRGDALEQLKHYDEALSWYDSWRPFAVNEKREGEVMIRRYALQAVMGRTHEAIEGYQALVTQYPRSAIAYESQFRLGYLYESQLGDFDAAGREYEKLKAEPAPSEFQAQASRRAVNLATIKQYRSTLLSDTTQARARAAFLLAEIYYFQIERVDSAMLQYEAVERGFPSSPYAAKAAFARLWIQTHDKGDTLAAAALTDTIANRYRKTRYAESALYLWRQWSGRSDARTALLDSLVANPDTTVIRERLEQPEPQVNISPADSTRPVIFETPGQIAERARQDSLAAYTRALYRARRQGLPLPPPSPRVTHPADADTSQTRSPAVPAPPEPTTGAPPDTTTGPTIGPSR